MSLFGLIKYLELLAALVAVLYYRKYATSHLRHFVFLLWGVAAVEFVMAAVKHFYEGVVVQNNFVYNLLTSIQYVYFFFVYYYTMKTARYKKIVAGFLVAFPVAVTINFLWIQRLTITAPFHSYTFTLGAILLMVTIGLFFAEILNTEKVLYFKRYLMFWISIGLFLFYTGIIPFMVGVNFMPLLLSSDMLSIIFFTLNLVMYSCFITGFALANTYTD